MAGVSDLWEGKRSIIIVIHGFGVAYRTLTVEAGQAHHAEKSLSSDLVPHTKVIF